MSSVELGVCPMQLFHFWSSDFHPVQNLLLCTKFHKKIGWFFTEIWRCNDFQNGSRPPSWNCFTTIRDHPRSLCCWPHLPVKLNFNLIHRSEDIAIWIFRIFGLKCLFRPPISQNEGFRGLWTPKRDYSSSRPPKGTSLRKSASFKYINCKNPHTGKFIFCPYPCPSDRQKVREVTISPIPLRHAPFSTGTIFGMWGQVADLINHANFYLNRSKGCDPEGVEICLTLLTWCIAPITV